MTAEEFVLSRYPKAVLKVIPGQYIGGKVRWEVFVGTKRIGCAMTTRSAWAEAMRWIKRKENGDE